MELKIYLNILLKKWWIVLPTFLITLTSGILFTYTQIPVYSATATYLVVPGSSFDTVGSFANGLDMLGRRQEIATTFAEIATSKRVKNLAMKTLALGSGQDYSISSNLRAGTNIIEITVDGPNPDIVQQLANTIGSTVEQYVQGLYEVFILVPLDEATTPVNPISPNYALNMALAAVLGLVLGGGLAFLSEYLETPLSSSTIGVNIVDDETGVYNKEYFLRRLSEEMVRARRNRYPLSLALMRIDDLTLIRGNDSSRVRSELLRQVAVLTNQYLREEDIVAYLENYIFALLLPDVTGENAKALMEYLQTRIAWTPFESDVGIKFNLKGIVGITAYTHNGTSPDELVANANRALQLAEVDDDGRAYLMTMTNSSLDENHVS